MKKALIPLIVVALLAVAGWFVYQNWFARSGLTAANPQWQMVAVERGPIEATVNATGVIQPRKQMALTFKTAGRIKAIHVEKGQAVRQGDILAELDTDEILLQVRQAEVSLQIAEQRAALARRQASPEDIAAAEANLQAARANLARLKEGPTASQLAAAEASLKAAEASYAKLLAGPTEADLKRAKLAIDQAKNSLWGAQNARDSLGYSVLAGAPRSQLDQAEAQVLNAEIAVELAEMNYRELQKPVGEAELQAALAQVAKARDAYLTLKESPRPSEIATAEAQVAQAEAALARLRAGASAEEVAIADKQVEQAQLALQQAQLMLQGATIKAPFDGIVASVNGDEGAIVSAATPVIVLVDASAFHIEVYVDEVDIASIREGQMVRLTLDALPNLEILGHVASVSPLPSTEGGIVTYGVRIDVEPTEAPLRIGMSANAAITTERKEDVLLVPNRAIIVDRESGTFYVEKWTQGQVVEVPISLGLRNELVTEVVQGVAEGEELVIRDQSFRERIRATFRGTSGG